MIGIHSRGQYTLAEDGNRIMSRDCSNIGISFASPTIIEFFKRIAPRLDPKVREFYASL